MRAQIPYLTLAALLAFAGCGGSGAGGASQSGGATSTTSSGGQQQSGGSGGGSSGGATGTGGTTASGGTTSTGGTTASGGVTASGGTTASGGRSGTGGSRASGGATSSGGQSATGGVTGAGGTRATGGSGSGRGGRTGTGAGGTDATGGSGSGRGGITGAGGTRATGGSTSGGGGSTGTGGADAGGAGDAVPSAGCGKPRTLQDGNRTISSGGQNRQYYLKTPSNYDNQHPYRLIFTFHWFYGSINSVVNPPDADHNTDRPFYGLSDLSGDTAIFVAPQGLTDSGGAGWANPNNRDVNFTDDMLKAITDDLCIDTSRVFTTGFSYGGSMSYELACDRPDKFRAALLLDPGTLSGTNSSTCKTPIAIFLSHGVDDQTLSYSGGLAIFNIFAKLNGCTTITPPTPPTNGHTCTSLEGCRDGYPARVCNFGSGENNPHKPDLRGHYPTPKDPGQTTSWVPEESWKFITQF
ncbi:MAG: prolyl oligopeptidase family serine peptidase [Deltaproteobacteria bacterium]|nr:prolyl oligopeptidase family serine peptidase [Deltaproteobacteria bacterium]